MSRVVTESLHDLKGESLDTLFWSLLCLLCAFFVELVK